MSLDVFLKKLEQMTELLAELETFLERPLDEFITERIVARAAERDFQLLVNLAVDINLYLIAERTGPRPTPVASRSSISSRWGSSSDPWPKRSVAAHGCATSSFTSTTSTSTWSSSIAPSASSWDPTDSTPGTSIAR
jgi:hypothetical protein